MKILYVANERNPAQLAATALRALGEDVRLEWARDLSSALSWVYYNRDVAALVVEDGLQNQSCAAFVDHVRSLGLAAPVIVVCPDDVGAPLLALKAGADDYIANNQSFLTNLPGLVARALQRAQAAAHLAGKQPLRLLYVGDAALARRCLENSAWSIEISEAERTSSGKFQPIPPASAAARDLPFDVLLVEHDHPAVDAFTILKEIASRSLNVRVILVVEWDEKLAVPAMKLGASDCVVKAADTFRALFFKLDRTRADVPLPKAHVNPAAEETVSRESLERQVREARAAARETQRSFDSAAAQFRERESRLQAALDRDRDSRRALEEQLERHSQDAVDVAEAARTRSALEERLAAAEAALAESEQERALAAAESADHLAKRSAEYRATLAQSLRARDALKLQLSDGIAALDAAKRELASEAASAAERLALREEELRTQISGAVADREQLEERVADLEAALEQSEQRCTLEAAASAERLAKRGAEFTASLGQALRAREALEQRLSEAAAALDAARLERAAEAAAAAERLARRESELGATLLDAAAARRALDQRLAESEAARQTAEERASAERAAASKEAAERQAAHDAASAAAADQRARREAELDAALAEAVAARRTVEQALVDTEAALQHAEMRASVERVAAQQTAEQHAGLEKRLASELAHANQARVTLQERVAEGEAALEESERLRDALAQQVSHASAALEEARQAAAADAHAGAERFRLREKEFAATIAEVTAARNTLETQLAETENALVRARHHATAAELTAGQQAAQHEAECEALRAQEAATRRNLGQALAEADATHQATAERHASEMATARAQLAERQAIADRALSEAAAAAADQLARREEELGVTIAETVTARDALARKLAAADLALTTANERAAAARGTLEQQVRDVTAALADAHQRHKAEAAAASDHLARREAALGATIEEGVAARHALEQALAGAETSRQQAEQRHASELAAAATRLAERQAEHDTQLAQADAAREAVEQRLSAVTAAFEQQVRDATSALADAHQRYEAEAAAASDHLARREAALGATIEEGVAARHALEQELVEAERSRQQAEQRHVSERAAAAARLAERQAEHDTQLAQADAAREAVEQRLSDVTAALEETRQRHLAEAAAASDHLARREAALGATIEEAVAARHALEQKLGQAETSRQQAEQRHAFELAAAAARLAERQADHDAMAAHAGAVQSALEGKLEETAAALAKSRAEGEALQESLGRTQEQVQQLTDAHDEARHSHERARAASEDEHRRLSAEYASLQETLGQLRVQFEALERVSAAHAAERARLDGVVTERDARLHEQAAMHQASQRAADQALTQIEEKLRLSLEAGGRETARFQSELSALSQELDAARRDRDTLRTQADRLPQVLAERDESRADNRRLFDHSPVGQFRCNRDGTLTQINRAFVGLLGYRTGDELRQVDFAKTVFESADDLHWLVERCLNTATAETVETTWRRKDGRRIVVKLVGLAASPDSIEIVVEDVTEIRELEDRLRRSHQMEAVGRLASEVAATCDNLLRDVSQDGQQWLAAIHDDTVLRHQGEMLLGEVTRAASFLRQLSVYGHKQTRALGPVTVQRVLRDLEPVLKRVAGADIELVLPKASPALNVDVEPERVERVFVNVASYARERMPHGGRLNIELATAIVDRRFLAKYPNVRPGDHVLITITEVRGTVPMGLLTGPPDDSAAPASQAAPEKPGVDLGALLSLVGDCGGHLWMSAEPPGNMVLKIHLPRPASDGQQDRHAPVPPPAQRRTRARWFRH
jgi:PAS domain S-box-containing protein